MWLQVLVDLGPAFVKIGQALSSRPDVLPPEYIEELELLQVSKLPLGNKQAPCSSGLEGEKEGWAISFAT